MDAIRAGFARAGLVRPFAGRWVAGVCAGVGERIGAPAWLLRVILVALTVLPGSALLVYAALWLCMPDSSWVPPARR
ncbi:PspC domain-containing protein [Cellulomonas oligotrophica]|uniref:Phage shock protein PspC (Stress-responsive transcriptional regulator) n=1 Tax=Cellulomonas oligotrophica TaxID=931536 RepID=A0A7Y9FJB9_9CELL|nr:PspC domain-containing protein [Cellulomonas oligotrophica]NYD87091.1 phage shock protein PspC (stress-responsive transcriptional regulator) [Cellulomonas oligotrophica]GIG32123.1 hypothetical protein Col01nite_12820 [Cellulomonas oligotrophica]